MTQTRSGAQLVAERLIEALRQSGFVVMKTPEAGMMTWPPRERDEGVSGRDRVRKAFRASTSGAVPLGGDGDTESAGSTNRRTPHKMKAPLTVTRRDAGEGHIVLVRSDGQIFYLTWQKSGQASVFHHRAVPPARGHRT